MASKRTTRSSSRKSAGMVDSEPFPALSSAAEQLQHVNGNGNGTSNGTASGAHAHAADGAARRRRKSSVLGGDINAGDTGAPAMASSRVSLDANDVNVQYANRHKRISKRRRARGFFARARQTMIKRTFVLPAIILLLFLAGYAVNPTESNPLHYFIFLSYKLPQDDPSVPAQYGKGLWDIAFVSFYTVVLSFTREFIMQEMLKPLARYCGLSRGKQARFMEQMYTAVYFGVLGPAGLYVMSLTPVWYFNTAGMYEDFPHTTHLAPVKFYYLFEAAYWAQQAIVLILGMEKPRKDFKELVGHHIVSLALIALSYRFHFTYIGLPVYVTHDISDFFLATSKTLNYLDSSLTGPYFVLFMGVWVYLRHVINIKIIWSLFTEFETIGPFEMDWDAGQFKCRLSQVITASLLSSLQALNLFWLFCIGRIAYRFAFQNELDDDRSDNEDDEEETPMPEPKANGNTVQNGNSKN